MNFTNPFAPPSPEERQAAAIEDIAKTLRRIEQNQENMHKGMNGIIGAIQQLLMK